MLIRSRCCRHHDYRVVTVAEGLENPWSMAFLPGGDMLVTERPGRLRIIRDGRYQGQLGILDHRGELDAEESLRQNLHGLRKAIAEIQANVTP